MKSVIFLLGTGLVSMLVGCSTTPLAVAPVGPNPAGRESVASTGDLEVFSRVAQQSDNQDQGGDGSPVWYQHTGYDICNPQGMLVKHVANATGHYANAPDRIALPAGRYLVRAEAKDYFWVEVPVTIQRGRTTVVHLDDNWRFPADAPKREVVTLPDGNPVGWRVESPQAGGIN